MADTWEIDFILTQETCFKDLDENYSLKDPFSYRLIHSLKSLRLLSLRSIHGIMDKPQ